MEIDRRPCAICEKDVPPESAAQRTVTGGLCDECLHHANAQSGMPLMDFLDGLDVPVLAVDEDMLAASANKPLLAVLGKSHEQVKGRRGGEVFECAHAREGDGCGRTVHCSGCAIRRAVMETFLTGRSLRNVQAYLNRDALTQFLQLGLRISTEKVWNMVLLRIDHIGPMQQSAPAETH